MGYKINCFELKPMLILKKLSGSRNKFLMYFFFYNFMENNVNFLNLKSFLICLAEFNDIILKIKH